MLELGGLDRSHLTFLSNKEIVVGGCLFVSGCPDSKKKKHKETVLNY